MRALVETWSLSSEEHVCALAFASESSAAAVVLLRASKDSAVISVVHSLLDSLTEVVSEDT